MIQSINNITMFNCQREHFYAKCSIYPSNALDCEPFQSMPPT